MRISALARSTSSRGSTWVRTERVWSSIAARSDERERLDVSFAAREPADVERTRVHRDGPAVGEHLGHELAGDGPVHEAVTAEAGDHVEPVGARDGAHDARLIRRHLVEPGPRAHELGV